MLESEGLLKEGLGREEEGETVVRMLMIIMVIVIAI